MTTAAVRLPFGLQTRSALVLGTSASCLLSPILTGSGRGFRRLIAGTTLGLTLLASIGVAAAEDGLVIVVTGSGSNQLPVAISPFTGDQSLASGLTSVIRADLERCGQFRLIDRVTQAPAQALPAFADLRAGGADAVVTGSVVATSVDQYETRIALHDVPKQSMLGGIAFSHSSAQQRATAHRISDFVFEKLIGERGIFSTRIAFVVKEAARYRLEVADADGANAITALVSTEPIISPSWSPDGARLAYVSFEAKKPVVYVHELSTGKRRIVANFKGSNSAPTWSPDGTQLAVVLSKEGGSQLFLINADGTGLRRIATSSGIDTEPRYSPDGTHIYFTSDRGGSPQIYRLSIGSGNTERISFEGGYNVSPRPSPDGKSLAYITQTNGRFQLVVMDLASKQSMVLTDSDKDESPSFAPNGKVILYATEIHGRGVLATVSIDGRIRQQLGTLTGDVREPSWSPFNGR